MAIDRGKMGTGLLMALLACGCAALTTVHVVPHSHEDPGWLLTSDEYYEGKAKSIITNVIESLEANPLRIFHYVEQVNTTGIAHRWGNSTHRSRRCSWVSLALLTGLRGLEHPAHSIRCADDRPSSAPPRTPAGTRTPYTCRYTSDAGGSPTPPSTGLSGSWCGASA